jgi:hypothetical protein
VPIEVKSAHHLRSKSLSSYIARYEPPLAYRASLAPHHVQDIITNVPLYAIEAVLGQTTGEPN